MKKNRIAIIGLTGQSIFMTVDQFHKDGETKQANTLYIEPGGKGYNQAIACKKLESDVYFLTAVGNDEHGKECKRVMDDLGIKTYYAIKEKNTAVATIITNDKGDNQVTVYKGASNLLDINDLNIFKEVIKSCNILLVQNEIPYEVLKESIKFAYENNVLVIYNPAPAIYPIEELLPYVNILIPNEVEASTIFNKNIDEIYIDNDLKLIVTLGSKGCLYIDKNGKKKFEALKVKTLDTTGAGDVFCASIASFLNDTHTIDELINLSTIASAIHVQRKYIIPAVPTLTEVYNIYNKKGV
jgi:ribokinase